MICSIAENCSFDEADTSDISFRVCCIFSFNLSYPAIISPDIFLPSFAFVVAFSTKAFISFAASADLEARFLTSCATTANPFPASPAVAASTAALSERIFVWNAI